MNQDQIEISDTVLSFTKFGLFLASFIIALTGIGLTYQGEYLFGGIAMGQFIFFIFFSRWFFNKLDKRLRIHNA